MFFKNQNSIILKKGKMKKYSQKQIIMKGKIVVLALLFTQTLFGQNPNFDKIINDFAQEKNFNGVALVATKGKIDYLKSVGQANRQTGTAMAKQTKFKIASITKTFTAVLILQLHEQGKLNLNDPISKFLSNYKGEKNNEATIHHLLTYSSGISNEPDKVAMDSYKMPSTLDSYIDKYCSGKSEFETGSKSNYNNVDFILLGKIIEVITKKSFSQVLTEQILKPLSMLNTGTLSSKDIVSNLADTYTYDDSTKTFYNDEFYLIENYFASAAMYSTAEDLLAFNNGIFNNVLLNKKTTDLMLTFYPNLGYVAYGFWGSEGYGNFNEKFYYRPGGILGANANWINTLGTHKTIIVLSNTNATNLFELSEQLYLESKK
jgi:teichoic acid D-alanine hydrolase